MSGRAAGILSEVVELLRTCHDERAEWMEDRLAPGRAGDQSAISDVKKHLAGGMGSLYDTGLNPPVHGLISAAEANSRLVALIEQFDAATAV